MSLQERLGWIWLDGAWKDQKDGSIPIATHTLHYGVGVFEGLRAYETPNGTAIFQCRAHTERLLNSAKAVHLPVNYDVETLLEAQKAVIRKNQLKSAYIRPLVYFGDDHLGLQLGPLHSHTAIFCWEWGEYFTPEARQRGINVCLSSYCRHDHKIVPTKAKACGLYVNSVLTLKEAQNKGCEEGLMLDVEGNVAEGSSANVFLVKDGTLITPTSPYILDGITRASIISLASLLGFPVEERTVSLEDVRTADEMFFTGTAVEVCPVATFEGQPIGRGRCGPITEQLYRTLKEVIAGEHADFAAWLDFVE